MMSSNSAVRGQPDSSGSETSLSAIASKREINVRSVSAIDSDIKQLQGNTSLSDIISAPEAKYHYRIVRDEISENVWAEYPLFYGTFNMKEEINNVIIELVYQLFPPYEDIFFDKCTIKVEVKLYNERIISIVLWYNEYSHNSTWPVSKQLSLNYDIKAGKEIRLKDIYDVRDCVKDPKQLEICVDDYINMQKAIIKKEYAIPNNYSSDDAFKQTLKMSRVILSDFDNGSGVLKLDLSEISHFSYFTEDKLGLIVAAYPRGCHVFEIPYEITETWVK